MVERDAACVSFHRRVKQPLIMKKVVYIAGPFRAATQWGQELNVRHAEALSLRVWKAGGVALCPHLNTRNFSGELPDFVWLDGDLELLARCDAILLSLNWRNSKGAVEEHQRAMFLGLPVFHESHFDILEGWL